MHIKWHPLEDKDGKAAKKYKKRVVEIGTARIQKRKAAQSRYRAKRAARMSLEFGGDNETPEMGAGAMLDLLD